MLMHNHEELDSELAETAAILKRLQTIEPDAEERSKLKTAYLAKGAHREPKRRFIGIRRVAALAAAIVLSSGGAVYAANDAMPDSALYPIKRTAESAALSVTSGETRAHLETVFARKRLREAGYLLEKNTVAAKKSRAIELLEEARRDGDRGLKNKVDELLERSAQNDRSRNGLKEERDNPGQGRAKEAPGQLKEKPGTGRAR